MELTIKIKMDSNAWMTKPVIVELGYVMAQVTEHVVRDGIGPNGKRIYMEDTDGNLTGNATISLA